MTSECFGIYVHRKELEENILDLTKFNYFFRTNIEKILIGSSREIFKRTKIHSDIDVELPNIKPSIYLVGIYNNLGFCLIFTTQVKPHSNLFILASQILLKGLKKTIPENFTYIESFEKINDIHKTINITKNIMIDNISKILENGEKIEDLLEKSIELEKTSRKFVINTKELNSCCVIL